VSRPKNTESLILVLVIVAAGLALSLVSGCSGESGDPEDGETYTQARYIQDEATPLNKFQSKCPVCGAPIDPEVHTSSKQKRVYFDSEECVKEWKNNQGEYMEKLQEQKPPGLEKMTGGN